MDYLIINELEFSMISYPNASHVILVAKLAQIPLLVHHVIKIALES